ncbi:MAG: PH domain-containing protein [Syntrophaceae bacterium]|nr:PH domain-containing protein [Syntrophaceae bacterium]
MPAYAARLLEPLEGVRYLTRPRLLSLGMLVVMTAVVLGLVVFSIVVEPGFIRLLSLPAFPLLGGLIASLMHAPVIFVTDRRIVFARRFLKPLSLGLERLEATQVRQNPLGRLLGYGELNLLFQPPQDLGEGIFLRFTLSKLPDAASLNSAISVSADAFKKNVAADGSFPAGL